ARDNVPSKGKYLIAGGIVLTLILSISVGMFLVNHSNENSTNSVEAFSTTDEQTPAQKATQPVVPKTTSSVVPHTSDMGEPPTNKTNRRISMFNGASSKPKGGLSVEYGEDDSTSSVLRLRPVLGAPASDRVAEERTKSREKTISPV